MSNKLIKIIGNSLNTVSYIAPKYASKKALHLFATPRKGRVLEHQKAFLESAERRILKYEDLSISTYLWKGKGDTILLAHGWESNTHRWEALINQLIQLDYTVAALDAPAHGASGGKQFNAILYSECIHVAAKHYKPQVLIGHSVGGMASAFYQHSYKNEALDKLVLLGAPSELTGVFERYVEMMGYNGKIENGLNSLITERFNKQPSYFSIAEFVKTIHTKTLIIHDVEDKIIPFSDAELIAENHNNVDFISTQGFGHGLRNNEVNTHIINFIKS